MPIDRTAFDALIDDDGTNTTGTVWNKAAIETVLLDPIDDAIADAGGGGSAPPVTLTDGATVALDASTQAAYYRLTSTVTPTISAPTGATDGQKIIIVFVASGGARTLALASGTGGFRFGTDVTALSTTASGKSDYIGCVYNGVATRWDVVAYSKGF